LSEPSAFEVETAIENLKRHKSPATDQILAEFVKARGRKIHNEVREFINSTVVSFFP
jgi:hypothetical protein